MANGGIRQYLVGLGYQLDKEGLGRFQKSLQESHALVKAFALAVAGMATSVEESIRRTARTYEQLYYMSERTGVAVQKLQTFKFSLSQIGMDPDAMASTFARVKSLLLDDPWLGGLAEHWAPGIRKGKADVQDLMKGLAEEYAKIGTDQESSARAIQIREFAELLGFNRDELRHYTINRKEAEEQDKRAHEWLKSINFDTEKAAERSKEFNKEWRFAWFQIRSSVEKFTSDSFPVLTRLIEKFSEWLAGPGATILNEWAKEFEAWISKEENIKKVEDALIAVGKAAVAIGWAILEVIKAFVSLSDTIGPLEAIGVSLFVAWTAKALLVQGAIWAIGAAFAGVGGLIRGKGLLGLATVAVGGAAAYALTRGEGGDYGGGGDTPHGGGAPAAHPPATPPTAPGRHSSADEVVGPGGGVRARPVSFGGGGGDDTDVSTATFRMLGSWLRGDAGFRPLVELADESITNFVETMARMMSGEGPPAGGGEGSGDPGGGGGGRRGGRFSGMGPGKEQEKIGETPTAGAASAGDPRGMIPVLRELAKRYNIDPEKLIAVARSEGLATFTGDRGTSFGALQAHIGGGMGDEFRRDTGKDPSDPRNEAELLEYQVRHLSRTGWQPYHGAAKVNIRGFEGIGPGGASNVEGKQTSEWVTERQQKEAFHRRGAISALLRGQLDVAGGATGLEALVTSGGQEPGQGTGSHRHDRGGAADVWLRDKKTREILSAANPAHHRRIAEYVTAVVAAGATGIGAGPGYQGGRLHIGGGPRAFWGASGSGDTAAPWLRDAYRLGEMRRGRQASARPLGSGRDTQVANYTPTQNIRITVNPANARHGNQEVAANDKEAARVALRNQPTTLV